jgi:hypothetical protein
MGPLAWLKVIAQNSRSIVQVIKDGFGDWCNGFKKNRVIASVADRAAMERLGYACPPPTQGAEHRSSPHHAANH